MTDAIPFWRRHVAEAAVLTDATLGRWFADIALEGQSSERPNTSLIDLLVQFSLVRPVAKSYALTADGRLFAECLGILASVDVAQLLTHEKVTNSLTHGELAALWVRYKAMPTVADRNRLIENYLPLARYHAKRIHAKLPDEVELDDMMSAGIFGLMDAIDSFDLDRGVAFGTYSAPRIRGHILDELRSMDWVPRLVRSQSSRVDHAHKSLERELGRTPTDEELAKKLKIGKEEFTKISRDVGAVAVVSLFRKRYEINSSTDVREIDVLEDTRQVSPLTNAQKADLKEMITRGLSRAERLIIIHYYFEQMTMKEISITLDLSESRVSQMHSSILKRLQARLKATGS